MLPLSAGVAMLPSGGRLAQAASPVATSAVPRIDRVRPPSMVGGF